MLQGPVLVVQILKMHTEHNKPVFSSLRLCRAKSYPSLGVAASLCLVCLQRLPMNCYQLARIPQAW